MQKNKKLLYIICLIIGILLISGGTYLYLNKCDSNPPVEEKQVSLKDDFYENVNYETLKNAKISKDTGRWSRFDDAEDIIEERVDEITEEILADPNFKNEDIDALIELYEDYEGRDARGLSELQPYFDMIDKASTIEEFNNVMFTLERDLGINVLINYEYTADYYDSSKNVLCFGRMNVLMDVENYTNPKYEKVAKAADKITRRIFEMLGYDEEKTNKLVDDILEFIKEIQSKSIELKDINSALDLYHKYTLDELSNELKNIPIKQLLENLKIAEEEYYVVYDMGQYKAIDEYYIVEHLSLLKEIAKLNILGEFNSFTTTDNTLFELAISDEFGGTETSLEEYREDNIKALKQSYIDGEIEKRYEEKYFTEEDKQMISELVDEVKTYYKKIIEECDWLSSATKEEAIKKLDSMKVNIGHRGSTEIEIRVKIIPKSEGGTLISNMINVNRYTYDHFAEDFHEDPEEEGMYTYAVNAFYYPLDNSINFLAGFKELYEGETDYYRLLGFFGTVIAHEISHGFDNNGSTFDENGKPNEWWTETDRDNYNQLTKNIEDYYSKYEYMGIKVDGHTTLGENIADLAAMKAIVSIAEGKGATDEDFKKLFEAYAELWAIKMNKDTAESTMLSDTHSPNKVRVNAVLSSIDKFYEVYDIKEGDGMYVPQEERVGLW